MKKVLILSFLVSLLFPTPSYGNGNDCPYDIAFEKEEVKITCFKPKCKVSSIEVYPNMSKTDVWYYPIHLYGDIIYNNFPADNGIRQFYHDFMLQPKTGAVTELICDREAENKDRNFHHLCHKDKESAHVIRMEYGDTIAVGTSKTKTIIVNKTWKSERNVITKIGN